MGEKFTTKQKALLDFKFPELDPGKNITWICHVDATTPQDKALYDIIIGMDLLTELGLYVNTETKELYWEGHTAPLKQRGTLDNAETVNALYHLAVNPAILEA